MAIHGHYHVCLQGTAASRPATPGYDLIYYATDTGQLSVYDTGGAAWNNIGFSGLASPVTIGQGGTGQTTQTAAFDALSPTTTKGDLIVDNGTNAIRVAAGSNQRIIIYDSSQSAGIRVSDYATHSIPIITPTGVAVSATTGASYTDFFGGIGSMMMNFERFREARITLYGAVQIGSTSGTLKFVDTTNTQDITGTVTLNSTTASRKTSSWGSLNSATYGGDAVFELQAQQGVAADVLKVYSCQLELR